MYVNVPELKQIVVLNRRTHAVSRWPMSWAGNFPMALDEADHRLFVATRSPAGLVVLETGSGRILAALPGVGDADDLYYDPIRKRIYVSGGEGYVSVVRQQDADHYESLAKIRSSPGARTAGYFRETGKKDADRLYVAVPTRDGQGAEVRIYRPQD